MQCITKTYCHQNGRQDWSSLLEFFPPWDYVNVTSMLMFAPNVSFRLQGSTISGASAGYLVVGAPCLHPTCGAFAAKATPALEREIQRQMLDISRK